MKRQISVKKAVLAASLLCILTATVYAAIVTYRELSSTITVMAHYDMEVLEPDQVTILTHVDFGTLYRGPTVHTFPANPASEKFYFKNTGEAQFWIGMVVIDWPSDVELWIEGPLFGGLHPGEIKGPLAPGELADFYFCVTVGSTAPFGSYTPTIVFNAHDSAEG